MHHNRWYRMSIFALLGAAGLAAASQATWPPLLLSFTAVGLVGVALAIYELVYGNERT